MRYEEETERSPLPTGRRGCRFLLVIGVVWLSFAGLPGGGLSTRPEEAQASAAGCAAALATLAITVNHARQNPSAENLAAVTAAGINATIACKPERPPPLPPPPDDNPPGTTPPVVSPPADRTPPESEAGACVAAESLSYGTSAGAPLGGDPSLATIRLDWGDGSSTTQTLAWGTTVTLSHNYYYSSSPYPRSNPGEGSDGDPNGDGSDVYVLQATVLETGARSGYGVIEHVGPFPWPPPRANGVDGG